MSRGTKRSRTGPNSYHDEIDQVEDAYDTIHYREGTLWKFGSTRLAAPSVPIPLPLQSWESKTSWSPPDDAEYGLDPDNGWFDEVLEGEVPDSDTTPPKKARSKVSKRPHVVWKENYRQIYLDEVCRWAGRGDFIAENECRDCRSRSTTNQQPAEFRCDECFLPDLVCGACCIRRHKYSPLHRIQKWNGVRFVDTSLKDVGLKVQLGHANMFCTNPIRCHVAMRVLHTNGIHDVAIQYCGCERAIEPHLQLLRRRLYPATQIQTKTCATFELLNHLHKFALTTKSSTYDFYRGLEKLTSNTGVGVPKSRYRALFRMCLQWRHLKMLKWGGRGHDPTGVAGTKPGDLAIICPSCPWPGVNLKEGWENTPAEFLFLYFVIICLDANFRLKNNLVSNYSQDPGLGTGWAYMIARGAYEKYVLSRASESDISTCVGFQAMLKAESRNTAGLRYSGVGTGSCGRSEMVMPLGIGNLQKGERQCNMDFIFGSIVQPLLIPFVVVSYDICCQWFINLQSRIEGHWPESIKPPSHMKFTPAIPKLHEPMHQSTNHQMYSFNFIPGVGQTDGECCERIWAPHNILGNSTKTQGPGSRADVIDDHIGFWNWGKYSGMGKTLARQYKRSVVDRNLQVEGHRGLTESLEEGVSERWRKICEEWERAPHPKNNVKNPYEDGVDTLSEAEVRKELALEETLRMATGGAIYHTTSASGFVQMGLDLEESQRRISRLVSKTPENPTATQGGNLAEQRNLLRARIRTWEELAPVYMPGIIQYRALQASTSAVDTVSDLPEEFSLLLPSRIPAPHRNNVCQDGLPALEDRLRTAQCQDALNSLRHILKIKTRMIYFKNKHIRGQRQGNRSRVVIDRVHERARGAATKYRTAREAKLSLVGPGSWENQFRVLLSSDIRGYQDPNRLLPRRSRPGVLEDDALPLNVPDSSATNAVDVEIDIDEEDDFLVSQQRSRRDGTGETRRTLSWIWQRYQTDEEQGDRENGEDDILRVEWSKSRARVERSTEQVLLLKEEMRRTLETLAWKARWWEEQAGRRAEVSVSLAEGLRAYARYQADVQTNLKEEFKHLWLAPLSSTTDSELKVNEGDEDDEDEDEDEVEESEGVSDGVGGYAFQSHDWGGGGESALPLPSEIP